MAKKPPKPLQTEHEIELEKLFKLAELKIKYEPKIFRSHGKKKLGFRPDFYLPDLDMYIEIGNLKTKRKKMRMMRGQFPEVNVLFLDNREVELFSHVGQDKLADALVHLHAKTRSNGLTLEERENMLSPFL